MRTWTLMVLIAMALVLAGCPEKEETTVTVDTPQVTENTEVTEPMSTSEATPPPVEEEAGHSDAHITALVTEVEGLIGQWEAKLAAEAAAADSPAMIELNAVKEAFAATKTSVETTQAAMATAPEEAHGAMDEALHAAEDQLNLWKTEITGKLGGATDTAAETPEGEAAPEGEGEAAPEGEGAAGGH
jgi:hypothetical protein